MVGIRAVHRKRNVTNITDVNNSDVYNLYKKADRKIRKATKDKEVNPLKQYRFSRTKKKNNK